MSGSCGRDVAHKPVDMWTNRPSCMAAVLRLCCHLPGELWGCPTALGQRDKIQDQVSKPFVLTPLPDTSVVWWCSGDLSVACWVLEVPTTVLRTDPTAASKVVVVWLL